MKALVLYDSFFGNTEKIALSVAESLRANAEVLVLRVNKADPSSVSGIDLLVLGSPTRGFRPSEGITAFLNKLTPGSLNGINAAAFDTRVDTAVINSKMLRFMAKTFGYADKVMVNEMQKKGANLVSIGQGFIVNGNEGPLKDGELERAAEWAKTLVG